VKGDFPLNRLHTLRVLSALALPVLFLSCDDLGDEVTDPLESFRGYRDWPVLSTDHVDPSALGTAHQSGDARFVRVVYGDVERSGNGILPGSVIVMETFRIENDAILWPAEHGVLAMRKMSPGTYPESSDWEWTELSVNADEILDQGTDVAGGSCLSCHSGAPAAGGLGFCFSLQPQAAATSFDADVLPIFQANCVACHGGSGGLTLGSYTAVMNGGDSGAVIQPGNAAGSLLFQKIQSGEMPQGGSPLSAGDQATIAAWINEGALDN